VVEIVVGFREIVVDLAADAIAEVRGAPQAATVGLSGWIESRAVRAARSNGGFAYFTATSLRMGTQVAERDLAGVDAALEAAPLKNI
jgi:hypothetical protein